jgi:imidazolonepropionase
LLTLRGSGAPRCGPELNELNIIQDGSLLIRDGVLEQIGPTRRVENLAQARNAVEIDAYGKVVMPSFVDCHTHLAYPPPGVSDEDHAAAVHALMAAGGSRTALRWRVQLEAMARHGTTTVDIKTGVGPNAQAEHKLLRLLSKPPSVPLDVAASFLFRLSANEHGEAGNAEYCSFVCREFLPKIRQRNLARFVEVAWDPIAAHYPLFRQFLNTATELGFGCAVHADQFHTAAAVAMAMEHKAVSISHLEQATSSEVSMMVGSGMIATLLPCASFHTGSGNAPARALLDAGAPIALGSNFHPTCSPTLNMQAVVALACLRMGLTAAEAVSAATINGAHALGCASSTGSLEPGKSADIVILNISDYRDLAHSLGSNLVNATIKRGAVIYREAEVGASVENRRLPETPAVH